MASILHTGTMPLTEELILESRRLRRQLSFLRQELEIERLRNVELRLELDSAAPAGPGAAPATAAAPAGKQKLDQTRVIPRGVKVNEFEQGAAQIKFDKTSGFTKKKDKTNMIFIVVGVVLAVVIIGFVVIALLKVGSPAQ